MEDYKKKYEEAMFRMNKWVEGSEIIEPKEVAEFIFPELKESKDERIRKEIIEALKQLDREKCPVDTYPYLDWIAWLEKQEDKSVVLAKAGIEPYKDGNKWCILVGDNIQEGICGFGDTVDDALLEFLNELLEKQGSLSKINEKLRQNGIL